MGFNQKILKNAAILYAFCQIFFLINIQFPKTVNFDEFHYVPSAKQFLALAPNQNWEHPPLGKLLMAVGIGIFGDRPIGWRFMSTVFGSLTMVGIYFLALAMFESEEMALWITLLTLVNQLVYVQSRIGMLDTFMVAFLVWGMAAFCATWSSKIPAKKLKQYFRFTGLMFGLALACKWFAFVPLTCCILLFGLVRLLQKWGVVMGKPKETDWYRADLWAGIDWLEFLLSFIAIPLAAYFFTFLPFVFVPGAINSFTDIFAMQYRMWDGQLRVVTPHPYMSRWIDWPLITRPIWYAFDREGAGQNLVRGVLLLGNPLIMWSGLLALVACLWDWVQNRSRTTFFILFFYTLYYSCWIIIPRHISFYYYYYPAGLMLSFALAFVFYNRDYRKWVNLQTTRWVFLVTAFCFFIYFFPILAALRIPSESFRGWMWFQSWI